MSKAPKKTQQSLSEFDAPFLSFVPKGANHKKFFLLKSNGGNNMYELDKDTISKLEKIFKAEFSAEEKAALVEIEKSGLDKESMNAVKGALRLLSSVKKEIKEEVMKEAMAKAGFGSEKPEEIDEKEAKKKKEAELAKLKKEIESGMKVETSKSIMKHVPEDSKEVFEKVLKAAGLETVVVVDDPKYAAILKKQEETEALLKEERDMRITKEFKEKAEGYTHIAKSDDEFGEVLKDASENMSKENFEKLETTLKAADEQIEKGGLFNENGSDLPGGSDTMSKIEKAAAEIRKEYPELTKAQSILKATDANPELAVEYKKERQSK